MIIREISLLMSLTESGSREMKGREGDSGAVLHSI